MAEYIVEMPFAWIYNEADGTKRESIVRCRDCKHSIAYGNGCMFFAAGMGKFTETAMDVEPDGFCKWGERK